MGRYNEILPLTVYSPDKKTLYGVIPEVLEYTKTIRFNAASEIQFSVTQKYYDINKECWVTNPIYDKLVEDHLIYTPDNNDYFTFPIREIGDDTFYCVDENELPTRDDTMYESWGYNTSSKGYNNFSLQAETELFDIGARDGYSFPMGSLLSVRGNYYSTGDITTEDYYSCRACETFIPIKHGDVIYVDSYYNDSNTNSLVHLLNHRFCTYSEEDSTSFKGCNSDSTETGWEDFRQGTPYKYYNKSARIAVNKTTALTPFEKGFVRFSFFSVPNDGFSYSSKSGFVKIFSGERRCSRINNTYTIGDFSPKLQWFVITDVEEVDDGTNKKKIVTAYSYEYTLSKRTFSLSSEALAFYVPPAIKALVESDGWIIDKYNNGAGTTTITRAPQVMKQGVLNQLLDFLPNWKIGYVSSELMTKVRTIEEVDNANIYSFCMDNLQSAYQCYFVFDSVNQTISAYDYSDINTDCGVTFTWDNVIKEVESTNTDTTYANAIRIHTAEDQYSVGLVNPTGNNIIYDFTHIKPYLDFKADRERTLAEAIEEWEAEYQSARRESGFEGNCISYIRNIMQEIQYSSKLSMALSKYRAKAEVINMHLQDDKNSGKSIELSYLVGDTPRTENSMTTGSYKPKDNYENYHSKYLYDALLDLSRDYYDIYAQLNDVKASLNAIKDAKKTLAEKFAIDPRVITDNSILSKAEAEAIFPYIKEGDWTNANVIFSETYSAEDIYNTLVDVYKESQRDLVNILSSPQYEFNIKTINMLKLPEMNQHKENLRLGKHVNLEISPGKWVSPTLLEIFIDYIDENNTTLQFSTDYKRRPLNNRFADLFRTITQTSVKQSDFTFED